MGNFADVIVSVLITTFSKSLAALHYSEYLIIPIKIALLFSFFPIACFLLSKNFWRKEMLGLWKKRELGFAGDVFDGVLFCAGLFSANCLG